MRTKCVSSDFDWLASAYLPAQAQQVQQAQQAQAQQAQQAQLLEDRYKIYEKNRSHWLMGPAPNALPEGEQPINGDLTDPAVINTLGNATHQRFSLNDGANLYTSDVGIELSKEEMKRQEDFTAAVNYGQIVTGLLSLAIGGHFITKQFAFLTPFSRSLIAIVASLFDETYITKPKTSKPTNSEVYLVGKGFKGISSELSTALLDRVEAYKTLGKLASNWGSLIQPNLLNQVDADILAAAEELYGDQQVTYINEIVEAYRVKTFENIYEASAQEAWLKENPLMTISSDENLNNSQISIEEQVAIKTQQTAMPMQAQQIQAQQMQAQQIQAPMQMQAPIQVVTPELEEESILIPDEDESKVGGDDTEGADTGGADTGTDDNGGSSSGTRKIISFNK
jgi:hypothetical protein